MTGYMTFSQSIRANGDRHKANAERHLAEGHPDYAEGSMVKARRNWKRADDFDEWIRPKTQWEADAREIMMKIVTKTLYEGDGSANVGGLQGLIAKW